jgi:hypothetical protein
MQVSRPLSAWTRDTSLQGWIHGVSAFCMAPSCSSIMYSYVLLALLERNLWP